MVRFVDLVHFEIDRSNLFFFELYVVGKYVLVGVYLAQILHTEKRCFNRSYVYYNIYI